MNTSGRESRKLREHGRTGARVPGLPPSPDIVLMQAHMLSSYIIIYCVFCSTLLPDNRKSPELMAGAYAMSLPPARFNPVSGEIASAKAEAVVQQHRKE